jgi:hypothetical protein
MPLLHKTTYMILKTRIIAVFLLIIAVGIGFLATILKQLRAQASTSHSNLALISTVELTSSIELMYQKLIQKKWVIR